MNFRLAIRVATLPLIFLAILLLFIALWQTLGLPRPAELIALTEDYYAEYGYWVVFIGALIEGVLIINWYFPGSAIVILGVIFSRTGPLNPFLVVLIAILAFFLAYIINYALGRYGWYRVLLAFGLKEPLEKTRKRVVRHGPKAILLSYVHPNIGALTATSCGILFIPLSVFLVYSIIAVLAWNTIWGVLAYLVGTTVFKFMELKYLIPVVLIWLLTSSSSQLGPEQYCFSTKRI